MILMKVLYKDDIEALDTRYEKLAKEAHIRYFNERDAEAFLCDIRDIAYEALLLLGLRKTADVLVAEYNPPQDINSP